MEAEPFKKQPPTVVVVAEPGGVNKERANQISDRQTRAPMTKQLQRALAMGACERTQMLACVEYPDPDAAPRIRYLRARG
jgi:hypothetical protein